MFPFILIEFDDEILLIFSKLDEILLSFVFIFSKLDEILLSFVFIFSLFSLFLSK